MNILVTGGAGFIGSHLVEELVKRKKKGDEILVQDDLSEGKFENIEVLYKNEKIGVLNRDILVDPLLPVKFDVVYHLAAKHSVSKSFEEGERYIDVNVKGTWRLLNEYKGARFVNVSSVAAKDCAAPYGITKRAAEQLAALFPYTCSLRLFNVFGERQQGECVVPSFCKAMLKGEQPIIHGNGLQTRDFCYVKDVVNEIIDFGQGEKRNYWDSYEVGYGTCHTVIELFKRIAGFLNYNREPLYEEKRVGDTFFSLASSGASCANVGFVEGLKRTVRWFKSQV